MLFEFSDIFNFYEKFTFIEKIYFYAVILLFLIIIYFIELIIVRKKKKRQAQTIETEEKASVDPKDFDIENFTEEGQANEPEQTQEPNQEVQPTEAEEEILDFSNIKEPANETKVNLNESIKETPTQVHSTLDEEELSFGDEEELTFDDEEKLSFGDEEELTFDDEENFHLVMKKN